MSSTSITCASCGEKRTFAAEEFGVSTKARDVIRQIRELEARRAFDVLEARKHAQRGDVAELPALLDRVAVDFLDDGDENGWTALHEAARSGHADVLRLLVAKGADASKKTKYGQSVHDIARDVHHEDHPAMRFLGEL